MPLAKSQNLPMVCMQVVYQDDYSGMCTYHAEFEIDRGMNWDAALKCIEEEVGSFLHSD